MGFLSAVGHLLLALKLPGFSEGITPPANVPTGGLFTTGQSAIRAGLSFFLIIVLLLAFLYAFIGAIRYIFSRGDKQKIQASREKITYSVVGLIVAFLAFVLVGLVSRFVNVPLLKIPPPPAPADCNAAGGKCDVVCLPSETAVGGKKQCTDPTVCCIPLPTPTPTPAPTDCKDAGGLCAALCTPLENPVVKLQCGDFNVCCIPLAPTPTSTPTPISTPTPTVTPCLIIPGVCSGCVSISLVPSTTTPSKTVIPTASGLSGCSGFPVFFKENSCSPPSAIDLPGACSIIGTATGCTGTGFPAGLSSTNIYACIDKDGGVLEFNDAGESGFKLLTIIGGVPPTPTPTLTPTPKPTSTPTPTPTPKPTSTPTPSPTPTPMPCALSDSDGLGYNETCKDKTNSIVGYKDYCNATQIQYYECDFSIDSAGLCVKKDGLTCNDFGEICQVQPDGSPICTVTGSNVNGYVWVDSNNDGVKQQAEGRGGEEVRALLLPGKTLAQAATTDSFGQFLLGALKPGDYIISLTVPSGFTMSPFGNTCNCGGANEVSLTVPPSQNVYNAYNAFGIVPL